jgi:hypothetical protein
MPLGVTRATANRERTVAFDEERLAIVKDRIGDVLLSTITREMIEGFQAKRKLDGVSNRTVNMDVGTLRKVLKRCARIRAFFRTSDLDRDFEEELQSHVTMLTEDNVCRGMTPEEARRAALIRVGATASLRERHREARGLPAFDTLLHDLLFALRLLIKDRWFTAAVVVALALGVGVNTTVFTVINGWNLDGASV